MNLRGFSGRRVSFVMNDFRNLFGMEITVFIHIHIDGEIHRQIILTLDLGGSAYSQHYFFNKRLARCLSPWQSPDGVSVEVPLQKEILQNLSSLSGCHNASCG